MVGLEFNYKIDLLHGFRWHYHIYYEYFKFRVNIQICWYVFVCFQINIQTKFLILILCTPEQLSLTCLNLNAATGKGGTSIWGRKFEDEFSEHLKVSWQNNKVHVCKGGICLKCFAFCFWAAQCQRGGGDGK